MTPPPTLVFDLDGTLIDSHRDIADSVNEVLEALGRPTHAENEIKRMIGGGVGLLFERALGTDSASLAAEARRLFKGSYAARLTAHTRPYPGILDALRTLGDRGALLAIATNKPAMFTSVLIESLGLSAAGITAWASSDEAGERKPSARVVALALDRARARVGSRRQDPPSRTVYVGDMPVDFETARAFGCAVAGVAWGFDPEGLRALGPDHWIDTPVALATLAETAG